MSRPNDPGGLKGTKVMWNRISRVAPLLILAVIAYGCGTAENPTAPQLSTDAGGTLSTAKKLPKVDICHITGNGKYVKISVSENAKQAHLDHGDGIVGVDFDENCEPLSSTACVTFGPVVSSWGGDGIDFTFEVTTDSENTVVTYVLDVYPEPVTWDPIWVETDPLQSTTETGSGVYVLSDGSSMDWQRVRAVCLGGSEVIISPAANAWGYPPPAPGE